MNDYDRIARVIDYLDRHQREQPSLDELADQVGLSPFHVQRLFKRWAGVTPKTFLQCLTLAHARESLAAGDSVLDAALHAGLSGPGRLHDVCVKLAAASPGELKTGGKGWTIAAGFGESPFGRCCLGIGPRGVCHLSFVASTDAELAAQTLQSQWPNAQLTWTREASEMIATIFTEPAAAVDRPPLSLFVRGTPFQVRVWQALLEIPPGSVTSYGRLAKTLGAPSAARAVGTAIGQNRLAYLIPCHRVIRETGVIGDYRWGRPRKRALLAHEAATKLRSAEVQQAAQ